MPAGNLTKLKAVNRILRGAKEHPVSSLGNATQNDTLMAEQILDETLLEYQLTGQHVKQTKTTLTPDANGKIILPNNITAVRGWNRHRHRNFFFKEVNGDILLFDGDGEDSESPATSDFSSTGVNDDTVYVRLTQAMEFEDLPAAYQFAIADEAAVEYQMAVLGDPRADAALRAKANLSRARARAYDIRHRPNNQFEDGLSLGPRLGRAVPRSWPH